LAWPVPTVTSRSSTRCATKCETQSSCGTRPRKAFAKHPLISVTSFAKVYASGRTATWEMQI
jgi:hypothetical protein